MDLPSALLVPSSKNKKKFTPKFIVMLQDMELLESKIKKLKSFFQKKTFSRISGNGTLHLFFFLILKNRKKQPRGNLLYSRKFLTLSQKKSFLI